MNSLVVAASPAAIPVHCVTKTGLRALLADLAPEARRFAEVQGFAAQPGQHILLPDATGAVAAVLLGVEGIEARRRDPFAPGRLSASLPAGDYVLTGETGDPELAALGWLLQAYRFDRYRKPAPAAARLVLPDGVDGADLARIAGSVALARDLVNTPANDMGPAEIEGAIRALADETGAVVTAIVGDDLLVRNFPMVHAVGRASPRAPRLIDLVWGDPAHPKVTLVGKGVAFDTGGLDLKPSAGMLLMKKDMGGAAAAIAAVRMIMLAGLPVRLRLLVPAVENAVSGSSFRPGDILPSRKGLSVEIGNTDAEGRLILADALALADEEAPELLIDFATLTGAARTALGPELPPFYTHDEGLAAEIARLGQAVNDPVWRMPLWPPYERMLDSRIADLNHVSGGSFAGSVTAALFLNRFVEKTESYAHFDIYAWTPSAKPGRPEGGECQAARLTYALVRQLHPPG
ncbi:MAG: leucyl aminopeptidase family protein [Bosea sp. (in: a-proteobacteria)]|uniref:leucyl aminopeptidase family protein n=1 Tax=Bosea sp. (in: a-proteobacteria) TaxID=1871050 RepID=UPI0027332D90|nr:leucyl aminopeptidase family protein [Bosea sp. (in: a-proteobacteria)]MDP3601845.1 leucyl aminopeptidase family protein [Bosea sp. (in: a-proteobacteria)]